MNDSKINRYSLLIERELWARFKIACAQARQSMKDTLINLITAFCEQAERKEREK